MAGKQKKPTYMEIVQHLRNKSRQATKNITYKKSVHPQQMSVCHLVSCHMTRDAFIIAFIIRWARIIQVWELQLRNQISFLRI